MFPAKIENLRRNPVCLQRYRHVVARKRQHGLTTTLIYATTPRAGPASAGPVSCRPVFDPRCLARHPSRRNERRAFPLQEATMLDAPARPEQPAFPQILAIVRTALRDAVAAPTDRASLDVAGAALLAVAAIAQARRRHG
ncbi:hypothetical protein, partial [Ralstonia pseudosolanacearum]